MNRISRIALFGSSALLAAASLSVGGALAGPATDSGGAAPADAGKAVKPTKTQKAAIVKAWSKQDGGKAYKGPLKCMKVQLSASSRTVAGLRSNAQKYPKACTEHAFDGAALLYGSSQKWFMLTEGSAASKSQCKALKNLVGADVWQDLVAYADGLGCQNLDTCYGDSSPRSAAGGVARRAGVRVGSPQSALFPSPEC